MKHTVAALMQFLFPPFSVFADIFHASLLCRTRPRAKALGPVLENGVCRKDKECFRHLFFYAVPSEWSGDGLGLQQNRID